jgi:hypothetical protein
MWFFAHLGLTLGGAYCFDRASRAPQSSAASSHPTGPAALNYPLIAVASLGPDADKLINLVAYDSFERGVFHSLLGPFALLAVSVFALRRYRDSRPLQVALAWLFHLALDRVWRTPRILLWPAMGWRTASGSMRPSVFLAYMLRSLRNNPLDYAPELAGLAVVTVVGGWVLVRLVRSRRVQAQPARPAQQRTSHRTEL